MKFICLIFAGFLVIGCKSKETKQGLITPKEIIDLGALVTEDLPEKVWGKAFMAQMGFDKSNSFEIINQQIKFPDGTVSVSNSYFTLFNHGGPHVDAPNHLNLGGGIDSYSANVFAGPLKVIDVSDFPLGRSVPVDEILKYDIKSGDIVLIYTGYQPPKGNEMPHRIALTREAAEYLVNLPIRAFGTDALNVESDDNPSRIESDVATERIAPNHYIFLSKGIPIFEQLFNVQKLLGKQNMYFVGPPLNIKDGDGMMVRPFVLVFD